MSCRAEVLLPLYDDPAECSIFRVTTSARARSSSIRTQDEQVLRRSRLPRPSDAEILRDSHGCEPLLIRRALGPLQFGLERYKLLGSPHRSVTHVVERDVVARFRWFRSTLRPCTSGIELVKQSIAPNLDLSCTRGIQRQGRATSAGAPRSAARGTRPRSRLDSAAAARWLDSSTTPTRSCPSSRPRLALPVGDRGRDRRRPRSALSRRPGRRRGRSLMPRPLNLRADRLRCQTRFYPMRVMRSRKSRMR